MNDTPLPVVCFTRPGLSREEHGLAAYLEGLLARGKVWISKVRLPGRGWVLRACITSYRTDRGDLEALLTELDAALD